VALPDESCILDIEENSLIPLFSGLRTVLAVMFPITRRSDAVVASGSASAATAFFWDTVSLWRTSHCRVFDSRASTSRTELASRCCGWLAIDPLRDNVTVDEVSTVSSGVVLLADEDVSELLFSLSLRLLGDFSSLMVS